MKLVCRVMICMAFCSVSVFGQAPRASTGAQDSVQPNSTRNQAAGAPAQLLGGKEIEGVDVIIKKKPSGAAAAQAQLSGGKTFSATLPPGEYQLVMSWPSALPAGAQMKSFFESRSNILRVAAPGWQLTPGDEAGFAPGEWTQFERWPYAYAISGQNLKKGAGFIDRASEKIELVQDIVISGRVPVNVRATVLRANPGPVTSVPPPVPVQPPVN